MNITEGSADNWLHVRSNNNKINSGSNSTTSSNNDQGSPNPQVWDLRWFALLSGPLLFGTIILPLITGPAIRYLCQSYVTLRVYWRLGFVFLAVTNPVLFSALSYSANGDYKGVRACVSGCLMRLGPLILRVLSSLHCVAIQKAPVGLDLLLGCCFDGLALGLWCD